MASQWQLEIDNEGRQTEASCGLAARIAAAIAILAAVTFLDATPQMSLGSGGSEHRRVDRPMPSACGAEAVARAQREVLRIRPPDPPAYA
jgi:hypothetical protein